jgi:hypothetical protein
VNGLPDPTELLSPREVAELGKIHVRSACKLMRTALDGFYLRDQLRCTRKAWERWVRTAMDSTAETGPGTSGRTQSRDKRDLLDAAARRQRRRTETSVSLQQQIRPTQPRNQAR